MTAATERLFTDACRPDAMNGVCRQRGGESCAFDGAMIVLGCIADAAHLVHGPIACLGNSWESRGTRTTKGELHRRAYTTDLSELDIVYGAADKLRKAIRETAARRAPAGDLRLRDLRHRHDRRGYPRRLPRGRGRAGAPGDPGGCAGLRRPEEPRQPRRRRGAARARDRHGRAGLRRAARGEPGRRVQHRRRPGPDRAAARARRLHRARPPHRQRHLRGDPRRAPGAPERRRLRPGADQRRPRDAAALGRAVRRGLVLRPDRDRPVAARDGGGARRPRPAAAGACRGAHRRGGRPPRASDWPRTPRWRGRRPSSTPAASRAGRSSRRCRTWG